MCNIHWCFFLKHVRIYISLISPVLYNWRPNVICVKSPSILAELSGSGERTRSTSEPGRPEERADDSSVPRRLSDSEDGTEEPQWLVQELLKKNRRRHSLTLGDEEQIRRQQYHRISSTCSLEVAIEISTQMWKLMSELILTSPLKSSYFQPEDVSRVPPC